MSNPEKADICVPDTQETYHEESNNGKTCNETQETNLNESQDFRLLDYSEDDSVAMKTQSSGEDNCQKEPDLQPAPDTLQSKTDDKTITASDNKIENEEKTAEEETTESKLVKKSEEINDELTDNDEDEIIQGTPPHSYTPPKKADGDIEGASLKRKAGSFEEPPAKVLRTTSMDDAVTVKEQLAEEEESQSRDSYDELFQSTQRNVIIEETQDPSELTPNSLQSPSAPTERTDGDKEQQEKEEASSEKENCCKKDENLNVPAKLADTSANDSTVANVNSLHESDMQENEYEAKDTVTSSSAATESVDEKPQADTSDKKEAEVKATIKIVITDTTTADEGSHTSDSNCVEKVAEPEKPTENDEEIPSSQPTTTPEDESPSCLKSSSSCKSRVSVELVYDGTSRTANDDDSEPKPEVVEINDDTEKSSILESSTEIIFEPTNNGDSKSKLEVVNIDDSHEDGVEKIVLDRLDSNSEVTAMDKGTRESANETVYKSCYDSKSDFSYKSVLDSTKSVLDSNKSTLDSNKSTLDSNKSTLDSNKESSDAKTDSSRLMNGDDESKRSDKIVNVDSDSLSSYETPLAVLTRGNSNNMAIVSSRKLKGLLAPKDVDNIELISISDHEQDISNTDDGVRKSDLIHNSALAKTVQVEKEIGIYVKLRCLLQIDENTKEFLGKELTAVHCEPIMESALMRQKDDTASSSLADISDNKETSPGSVNSNPHPFALNNPYRLSMMSSVSSSSSASSAASLAAKLAKESVLFSLPRGPAKHAKKMSQEVLSSMSEKQSLDETYERVTREWLNNRLLTATVLNCANAELSTLDSYNLSNERLDDHHLQKMHSSTPEAAAAENIELTTTPKSTKKVKSLKRPRSKTTRSRVAHTNGESKSCTPITHTEDESTPRKKNKTEVSIASDSSEGVKLVISGADVLANSSPLPVDNLIGRKVFAKWSDNNYYPGKVIDRMKTKYKVNFYDGKNKVLIPEFVIPIPKTLREGLSVYATTQANDYGSCGIIVDVKCGKDADEDDVRYTVETDEGERLHVQVKDIFLSADQAQVLKEEMDSENNKSLPSTPKHLDQVTLDNMVDGKRRSKRIGTPVFSTPKSRNSSSSTKMKSEPSSSGMAAKMKSKRSALSENESLSSDANSEPVAQDEYTMLGVQREIIGTPHALVVKGPISRLKSKRSKKKTDDKETIAILGPIPTDNTIFEDMSFVLTCVALESLDRYQEQAGQEENNFAASGTEETETDNEQEWMERPFVRDRLHTQIVAGGGKVYEDFNDIPKDQYANTKLITNVPNITAKSILCLSVGILAYNHKWIIRCCAEVS